MNSNYTSITVAARLRGYGASRADYGRTYVPTGLTLNPNPNLNRNPYPGYVNSLSRISPKLMLLRVENNFNPADGI